MRTCLIAALLWMAATPATAHHSFETEYNSNKPITLTGNVTKLLWENPHAFLTLEVKDSKTGKFSSWSIELGSLGSLTKQGWTKNTVGVNDALTVFGIHAFESSNKVLARTVTVVQTGQRFLLQGPGA